MSVYRRPNGRWALQLYDPSTGRMRQAGTFDTRREARAAEAAARPGSAATVGEFAARWTIDFPRPAASTNRHNQERVARFAARYGRTRMDRLDPLVARRWALAHPSAVPALRAMWNDARRAGLAASNPFAGLGLKQSRGRRDLEPGWLTGPDIDRLCAACEHVHGAYGVVLAAMVRVGAETGLRPGELYALDRADLDGDVLHVTRAARSSVREIGPPKNGQARDVVCPPAAVEALVRCPQLHATRVFASVTGRQLWAPAVSMLWRPVRHAAGLEAITLHHLRHYCATRLVEAGLAPWDVAVQLGHRDGGQLVMDRYGHPSERLALDRIRMSVNADRSPTTADRAARPRRVAQGGRS